MAINTAALARHARAQIAALTVTIRHSGLTDGEGTASFQSNNAPIVAIDGSLNFMAGGSIVVMKDIFTKLPKQDDVIEVKSGEIWNAYAIDNIGGLEDENNPHMQLLISPQGD